MCSINAASHLSDCVTEEMLNQWNNIHEITQENKNVLVYLFNKIVLLWSTAKVKVGDVRTGALWNSYSKT